jgi:hypothetical protein
VTADGVFDLGHEVGEGEGLRAGKIEYHIAVGLAEIGRDACQVEDRNGLKTAAAPVGQQEERQPAQQPGDVVHEHFLATAEDQRRPQDRVRAIGASKRIFNRCLASEIRERRVCAGIANAEMDDAAHLSASRGMEEAATALDRLGEGRATVLEAHPIGVEERLRAREGGDKRLLVIKEERIEVDALREALGGRWLLSAEGDNLPTARQQRLGDEAAAVGEDAGDRPLSFPRDSTHTHPVETWPRQAVVRSARVEVRSYRVLVEPRHAPSMGQTLRNPRRATNATGARRESVGSEAGPRARDLL